MARFDDLRGRIRAALDGLAVCRPAVSVRSVAGWTVYGVVVFLAVFALRWAALNADGLADRLLGDVNGLRVGVSGLEPSLLPPGAHVAEILVSDTATGKPLFSMRDAELRLHPLSLLLTRLSLSLEGRSYGGRGRVDLASGSLFDFDRVDAGFHLDTVEIRGIPQMMAYDPSMTGFATLDASVQGEWTRPKGLTGNVSLALDRAEMANRFKLIRARRLRDCAVRMRFSLADGVLTSEEFVVKGEKGVTLDAQGTVTVDQKLFDNSKINIHGNISADRQAMEEAFGAETMARLSRNGRLSATLGGRVSAPILSLKK